MPEPQSPLKLLIVDDHAIVRDGLEAMLRLALRDVQITTAATGAQAVQLCANVRPAIVLLDVRMPGNDGFSVLEALQREQPSTRVLLLSASATPAEVGLARRMGAAGYLSKSADGSEVVQAIKTIMKGGTCFAPGDASETAPACELSARELDVLRHLGRGLSNQELATALGISETTVKAHLRAVFAKLNVANRTEAVTCAYQMGLVSVDTPPGQGRSK
jgi:DNA-binding NarL/FixJ family response regulator